MFKEDAQDAAVDLWLVQQVIKLGRCSCTFERLRGSLNIKLNGMSFALLVALHVLIVDSWLHLKNVLCQHRLSYLPKCQSWLNLFLAVMLMVSRVQLRSEAIRSTHTKQQSCYLHIVAGA